ncbi:MAG: hypothetical protein M0R80_06675 [Proteobacteria bacterium]|jgi:hypothetical protein|nr:hypothetical protein [Pseudomonadota bacterium]
MRKPKAIAIVTSLTAALVAGCGGAQPESTAPDGVSGATDVAPAPRDAGPEPPAGEAEQAGHVCEASIGAPGEVWPRLEAIRALPEEERAARCGLDLVPIISAWRTLPVDILGPVVERAAGDPTALDAWVASAGKSAPGAAAGVVAMDVIGRFAVGGDPKAIEERRAYWGGGPAAGVPEIAAVLEEAKALPKLLAEVNAMHELRCLLEVNALGFAMKCKPIHPATTPITLNWTSAVRDGVLEKLELTDCFGKSCPKLKATSTKLLTRYRALVDEIRKLESPVYRERLFALVVLPPFSSRSDGQ